MLNWTKHVGMAALLAVSLLMAGLPIVHITNSDGQRPAFTLNICDPVPGVGYSSMQSTLARPSVAARPPILLLSEFLLPGDNMIVSLPLDPPDPPPPRPTA